MNLKKLVLSVSISLLVIPSLALGEQKLHLGLFTMELQPYVSVSEKYTDNVYSVSANEDSDYITTFNPGLSVKIPVRRHLLYFDYNAVVNRHDDHDKEDTTDNNHFALQDFKIGDRFGLTLTEAYNKGHEPRGSSATGFIERFETKTFSGSASYALMDVSKVQIDYWTKDWSFENSANDFRERQEDQASFYIYYKFLPKTSLFAEYDHRTIDYDRVVSLDLDSDADSALIGLKWDISERSTGTVKGGYTWKDYDSAATEDYDTWTASVNISHEFDRYNHISLLGERTINETNLTANIRHFVTTGAAVEFKHRFLERLAASVRGSYGRDLFSDKGSFAKVREDDTVSAGLGFEYEMRRWLAFLINYNYRERDSNINSNDYSENSVMLTARIKL